MIKKIIKRVFNKLGYDVKKFGVGGNSDIRFNDHSYEKLFSYFPIWKSKFLINDSKFGGTNDYSTLRISLLNMPEVLNTVDFNGKRVLELGPLEGGNTIKLEKLNPVKIVSIEGRIESYLKCCMIKNIYELNRTKFYLDDVMNINPAKYGTFDIAVILGLLYHLDQPQELFQKLALMANTLLIATHYADDTSPYPKADNKTIKTKKGEYSGRLYVEDPDSDPNAGLQYKSFWPYEKDLLQMCKDAGFTDINILARNPDPNEQYKLIYFIAEKK